MLSPTILRLIQRSALACEHAYHSDQRPIPNGIAGVKQTWFMGQGPDVNVAAVLIERPDARILSFQGTTLPSRSNTEQNVRFLRDWIDNFRFALKRHQLGLPGKTHLGFARQLGILWEQIEPVLKQSNTPIQLTGHSQGGAIAILATKLLELKGYRLEPTVVFGAPRAADSEFVQALNTSVWRVEHDNDLVPFVPPRISPINKVLAENVVQAMPELFRDLAKRLLDTGVEAGLEYRPAGQLVYIRPGKPWVTELSDLEQLQRLLRLFIAGRELIDDHWIDVYVQAVAQPLLTQE